MPEALRQSVETALQAYSPLRTSRSEVTVTVNDRMITRSGYAPSMSIKRMAAILAGSVASVNEVVNDLVADPELERSVALALGQDERTRSWSIRVRSELGYVQRQGQVPDEQTVEVALEVARGVKGPRGIFSALKVQEPAPSSAA